MAMSRSLGEGRIYKLIKKSAYIKDDRLGDVFLPLLAASVASSDCNDLREKFKDDDLVVFTATKQPTEQNGYRYIASSAIKKKDLIPVVGKISEVNEKFCYAEVKKYGRVFVPYSARTDQHRAWLGKGSEKGKEISLKIFRQPDINQCKFVAWGVSMPDSSEDTNRMSGSGRGAEKQPDQASGETGVIVSHPISGDSHIYSAHTGLARLPFSLRKDWMIAGRFLRYDVIKQQGADVKVHWVAKNCVDLGTLYTIYEDYMDSTKLHLDVYAVVNRISTSARAAWLWNDFIGRIYVPPSCFVRGLRAMTSVRIRALYTGAFEDVPWSAVTVELVGEDDDIRLANAQLLLTDDNWVVSTVKYVHPQQQSFYGFMDHPKFGSAFIAWTDLTEGDTPPVQGAMCRATVYHQQRNNKHAWRAVMVTPLGEDGQLQSHHPIYTHSGVSKLPEPVEPPHAPSPPPELSIPSSLSAPFGFMNGNGQSFASKTAAKVASYGWNGNGHLNAYSSVVAASNGTPPPAPPVMESPEAQLSPAPRVMSSDSSDSYSDQTGDVDLGQMAAFNRWSNSNEILSWPMFGPSSFGAPSFPGSVSEEGGGSVAGGLGGTITPSLLTTDSSTQTEAFSEQVVLRDIFKNTELLMNVISKFPEHAERIFSMRSVWKF